MDLKPKNLLRRVVDAARQEIARRSKPPVRQPGQPPAQPAEIVSPPAIARPATAVGAETDGEPPPPPDEAETQLGCQRQDTQTLEVHWGTCAEDLELAGAGAEGAGESEVVMRCVVLSADASGVLERRVLDRAGRSGRTSLTVGAGTRCVVAIGVRRAGAFTSIAHLDEGAE